MYQVVPTQGNLIRHISSNCGTGKCAYCMTQMPLSALRVAHLRSTAQNNLTLVCANNKACGLRKPKFFANTDDLTSWAA